MPRRLSRQAGLGLTEVLVSIAVLSLAMTTALVLYDGARRSFHLNENIIDQQQVVRIAFDMLGADVRMAGFNTNPDGSEDRPDEQIEAAFGTAIVVRADLDAQTPEARIPEADLETAGIFDAVSTGNDEIVGYALGNPAASGTLTYQADVAGQTRDGNVESVSVPGIAFVHDAPPYTLYRITLDVNAGVVKTPLADNVRSMRFTYFDQAGNPVTAVGGGESAADVRTRQTIRRVLVEIEGLTRDADRDWIDPADTNPYSRQRRKFNLSGDIRPRNLGVKGQMDLSSELTLPAPETTPVLVPGHCKGLYVKWSVPPRDQWGYVVNWEDSDGVIGGPITAAGDGVYVSGLTDNRLHDVTLSSVDPFGNVSDPTPASNATTTNIAAPAAPQNLIASDNLPGSVDLSWDVVTANDAPIPGDPQTPLLRDLRQYELQRRKVVAGIWEAIVPVGSQVTHSDTTVEACVDYEFRVRGTDECGGDGSWSAPANGIAQAQIAPLAPSNIEAFFLGGGTSARIGWQKVDHTVALDPVEVDYEIYRVYWAPGDPPVDLGLYQNIATVQGVVTPLQYVDTTLSIPPSQTVFYRVVAVDGCGNASGPSDAAEPVYCAFTGEVAIVNPAWEDDTTGFNVVQVDVTGGAEVYSGLQVEFTNLDTWITNPVVVCPFSVPCQETGVPGWKSWQVDWNNLLARPYRIEATVTTAGGCSVTRTVLVGPGL